MQQHAVDAELDLAFAVARNPGAYALLLGAGVSTEAGIPAARAVQLALLQQAAAAAGEQPDDPAAWWRATTGREVRYDDLLRRIAPSLAERQAVLRPFFEPTADERQDGDKQPGEAHRAIARLVAAGRIRIVVTLNFDHLVEQALREAHVTPTVVSTPAEMAALLPLHAQQALVVHLHGDWSDPASMRNTEDELADYGPVVEDLVGRIVRDHGLVIAGWSATWDPALRALLAAPNRFYTSWWIDPFPLAEPAERLRVLRGAALIEDTAGGALGRLADAVDAIETTAARHPRLPALAVATAKRALRAGGRPIGLHDQLVGEFERLADAVPSAVRRPTSEELAALEERTRVLLPLVATTAYWGTAETDRWWGPEIGRFASGNGSDRAAATLLLAAGGTAAAAGGRFDLVHELLTGVTVPGTNGYAGAAEALATDRPLPFAGAARWLHDVLHRAVAGLAGIGERAWPDAWDLFTYLQALERVGPRVDVEALRSLAPLVAAGWAAESPAALTFAAAGEAERTLRRSILDRVAVELPVPHLRGGGYGGHRYPRISAALRRELRRERDGHPLVRAGFGGGDAEVLGTTVAVVDALIAAAPRPRSAGADPEGWLD